MRQTFRKSERLSSRKQIEALVKSGQKKIASPLRVLYSSSENERSSPVQVAFAVSKKLHKKAVDRNRIKRLMREAYRKNKFNLIDCLNARQKKLDILISYAASVIPDYKTIEEKLKVILSHLEKDCC